MAGLTIETWSDAGFVAVDRPGAAAWIYRTNPDNGRFELDVSPDPSLLDVDGTRALDLERALTAGLEHDLDVIALPDAESEPDEEPVISDDLFAGVPAGGES
jgi:hypothetical protein